MIIVTIGVSVGFLLLANYAIKQREQNIELKVRISELENELTLTQKEKLNYENKYYSVIDKLKINGSKISTSALNTPKQTSENNHSSETASLPSAIPLISANEIISSSSNDCTSSYCNSDSSYDTGSSSCSSSDY
jgi:hypothetical protein